MKAVKLIGRVAAFLGLLGVLLIIYGFQIEPHSLMEKEYRIEKRKENHWNRDKQNLTIIQLSDLEISRHYTEKELTKIVKKVNSKHPDFVFFTGDLFENYARYHPTEEVIKALRSIQAVYGKYSIWGNNDYGGGALRVYESIMEQAGFQVLQNEGVTQVISNGEKVFIGGLDDKQLGRPNLEQMMKDMDKTSQLKILLIHEPEMVHFIKTDSFDLILAGHNHGGQVNLEFLRKLLHMDIKYREGFYQLDHMPNTTLYVNSGMGTSRLPVRFFVPPEIACFQVTV